MVPAEGGRVHEEKEIRVNAPIPITRGGATMGEAVAAEAAAAWIAVQ